MKDLDFDELDRAVNSLMTNVPKTPTQSSEPQEKTLNIATTLDGDTPPSFDAIEKTAIQATTTPVAVTPKPSSLPTPTRPTVLRDVTPAHLVPPAPAPTRAQPSITPAARRSGKFMDVVRPSQPKQDDERPVSRQGVTIQPSSNPIVEEPASQPKPPIEETPVPAESHDKEVASPVVSSSAVEAPTNDWPDPLDMQPTTTSPTEPSLDKSEPEPVEELNTPNQTSKDASSPQEPLTSPFLPDAKVEKRPLGGSSPLALPSDITEEPEAEAAPLPAEKEPTGPTLPKAPAAETGSSDATAETDSSNTIAKTPSSQSVDTPLPEELSNDLMAVEADTTHDELKKEHDSAAEENTSLDKEETKEQSPAAPIHHQDEKANVSVSTSIPQQYHEVPSTGDKDSGSIYDTNTYHQPLTHPKKKNTGRTILLWAIVVLLLGIAAGAGLYFSGII